MSAFIVSRLHIRYLVEAAVILPRRECRHGGGFTWFSMGNWHTVHAGDATELSRIGQILWDENIRSVLYRYPGDTITTAPGTIGETYQYDHTPSPHTDIKSVAVLKAISSLDYQSCEHPEWEQSEAYAILEALKRYAIVTLPGYDDATWDIA